MKNTSREMQLQLESDHTEIAILYDISMIMGVTSLNELLAIVIERITRSLSCETAALLLLDNAGQARVAQSRGVQQDILDAHLQQNFGHLLMSEAEEVSSQAHIIVESDRTSIDSVSYSGLILQPIQSKGMVLGYLFGARVHDLPFDEVDQRLFSILAQKCYSALENILLKDEILRQSITDPLTNLYNTRHISKLAPLLIQDAIQKSVPLLLVMIDLRNFKEVNDRLGHQFGDSLLEAFSVYLKKVFRASDHMFRVGGDEFMLILFNCPAGLIPSVQEKIRGFSSEQIVGRIKKKNIVFGVNSGFAVLPEDGTSFESLYKIADRNMYAEKRQHRKGEV